MFAAMLVLLLACAAPPGSEGVAVVTEGPGFFDRPWPSDTRLVDGRLDLQGFPRQGTNDLIDEYLALGETLTGFGTNAPIYVRLADAPDLDLLPSPADSTRLDSPVMLLDVDPRSPHRGERVPLAFEWSPDLTSWRPGNLLAAAPLFGFPLRPATTYALILRSPLVRDAGQEVWGARGDARYASTEATLVGLGIDPRSVSLAVVFTTQDPTAELAAIAETIHSRIALPELTGPVERYADRQDYAVYTGTVRVPVWQEGERPYRDAGGGFVFDAEGQPLPDHWEEVSFALSIPEGDPPADGWPVVLYGHGTGGSYLTFAETGDNQEEATVLARVGVAVIGISQPLHADRGTPDTNVDLDSFNFLNPVAGRTNFRQGAADTIYLARALASRGARFVGPEGEELRLDPRRVAYFGHSQGGLTGALAAPFLRGDVRAVGCSGTGGGLAITLVQRDDPVDIAALIETLFGFDEGEDLTTFHPVTGLIQTLVEVTDPLNYAPWVYAEAPAWPAEPLPLLLTEGLHDEATPPDATEALAAAARTPIVGDPATDPVALELRDLEPQALPAADNVTGWTGERLTAGLAQFPSDDHYAIYDNGQARRLYRDFLASALDGEPVLAE